MDMKKLRERVNLRGEDVASRLGIAESTVRNWEAGKTMPRLRVDETLQLCRVYDCSLEMLVKAAQASSSQLVTKENK